MQMAQMNAYKLIDDSFLVCQLNLQKLIPIIQNALAGDSGRGIYFNVLKWYHKNYSKCYLLQVFKEQQAPVNWQELQLFPGNSQKEYACI